MTTPPNRSADEEEAVRDAVAQEFCCPKNSVTAQEIRTGKACYHKGREQLAEQLFARLDRVTAYSRNDIAAAIKDLP